MIYFLNQNVGWETLNKKEYVDIMKELRNLAFEMLKKEHVEHVIYATKKYTKKDEQENIHVIPYAILCSESEFQDYCSRETENHIIKSVHKK